MVLKSSTFEGGTDGTVLTTANSGGTSGTAFDAVTGSPSFAAAAALHGSLGLSCAPAAGTATSVTWSTGFSASTSMKTRFYYKPSGTPGAQIQLFRFRTSGSAQVAAIVVTTANKLGFLDSAGATVFTTTAALTAGTWYRIEVQVLSDAAAGTIAAQVYLGDSTTPLFTQTASAQHTNGGVLTSIVFGKVSASGGDGGLAYLFDDLAVGDGDLTPIGPSVVTDKGSAAGAFTFAGVATGSARHAGSSAGSARWVGVAAGAASHVGAAAGAASWTGVAAGASVRRGTATGNCSFTGTAAGARSATAAGSGTVTWGASATGLRPANGAATGTLTWMAAAAGRNVEVATPAERMTAIIAEPRRAGVPREVRIGTVQVEPRTIVLKG